jgi:hypothetical protein
MQTREAEMLGLTFPICAVSHCRDAAVAVTDLAGLAHESQLGEGAGW